MKLEKIKKIEEFPKNTIIQKIKELTSIYTIGPKKAQQLINKGIVSIDDLRKKSIENNQLLTDAQKIALKYYDDLHKKIPRKECEDIKNKIEKEFIKKYGKDGIVILAGSYMRNKDNMNDIDIILSVKNRKHIDDILSDFIKYLIDKKIIIDSLSKIPTEKSKIYTGIVKYKNNPTRHIDIHIVEYKNIPFHILYFGSGKLFSRYIRLEAKKQGYLLNNKGLFYKKTKKKVRNIKTEKDIFEKLSIEWVPYNKR